MSLPEYVTINGTSYSTAKLSDAARGQVANLQVVDAEIARLQQQVAIMQTARNAYVAALIEAVKAKKDAAAAETKKPAPAEAKKPAPAAAAAPAPTPAKKPAAPKAKKAAAPAAPAKKPRASGKATAKG